MTDLEMVIYQECLELTCHQKEIAYLAWLTRVSVTQFTYGWCSIREQCVAYACFHHSGILYFMPGFMWASYGSMDDVVEVRPDHQCSFSNTRRMELIDEKGMLVKYNSFQMQTLWAVPCNIATLSELDQICFMNWVIYWCTFHVRQHHINLTFCNSEKIASSLLRIWAATPKWPNTGFSLQLLQMLNLLTTECAVSVAGFLQTLRWMHNLTDKQVCNY